MWYRATAVLLTPDQRVGSSILCVLTCMAVKYHGFLQGSVCWRVLSSYPALNSGYARPKEAPPHDRRTSEATIRPHRVNALGRWCIRLQFRQGSGCARPTELGADEVQLSLQHERLQKCMRGLNGHIAQLARAYGQSPYGPRFKPAWDQCVFMRKVSPCLPNVMRFDFPLVAHGRLGKCRQ